MTDAEIARAELAERELEIGRRIQRGFLPDELPQPPGWEIAARFQAARDVAGDFYDAFALAGGKRIGLVIADVCDKGVGAALFMALFRTLIRAFADQHYSLSWMDVLSDDSQSNSLLDLRGTSKVERRRTQLSAGAAALKNAVTLTNAYVIRNHAKSNMFATMFFGILDPASGLMNYINAGHESPFVIGDTGVRARLDPSGPAVGLMPDVEFAIESVTLQAGETMLAFTDGVIDARDPTGARFDEERLSQLVNEPAQSASLLLDRIHFRVAAHIGSGAQFDDITMLAARRAAL